MCIEAFVKGVKSNAHTARDEQRGVPMIKDQAVGRLFRLVEQCDAATVVRIADELEDTLEIGPYGVRQLHDGVGPIFANAVEHCARGAEIAEPVANLT